MERCSDRQTSLVHVSPVEGNLNNGDNLVSQTHTAEILGHRRNRIQSNKSRKIPSFSTKMESLGVFYSASEKCKLYVQFKNHIVFDSNLQSTHGLEYSRKKKPSGNKTERRKEKLPNQIRHDQNAAIAVGTWKKKPSIKERKQ